LDVGAENYLPEPIRGLAGLRAAAEDCRGCDLYRRATQTVFGEGSSRKASVLVVGEQPGDAEDKEGRPFVGPAGSVLDDALDRLGVDRSSLYVTNAVKHFKWEPRGKARLHKNPSAREVAACRPWLMAEIEVVHPALVVGLGATAARALLGPGARVLRQRGQILEGPHGVPVLVTVHPASIVRVREPADRHAAFEQFVRDLRPILAHVAARV
jgi:uracil-DNA glycosylase family protein